ncbi:MAG: thioredoxin family protein [Rhodobacteraceae bacterium]|nr:thioredoxin family protein [Paracoccaceae bacterium]MCW9043546.1 thioredoxin family protein [Pseudopelagicola sp.]
MTLRSALLSVMLFCGSLLPAWAVELVIVEQAGCYSCRLWNEEIAPIYPKTEAGQFAPLRRAELRHKPQDLTYARAINFTPTFLLIEDGQEVARLEGYPGEDFFWWHIEKMLADNTEFDGSTR